MAEERDTVIVEDDDDEQQNQGAAKEVEYVAVEKKPEEVDDDDDEDERPESRSEDGVDREELRARRREEKRERKERRDMAIKRDKLELDFLRKRNDDLEQRINRVEHFSHQQVMGGVDQQLAAAIQEAQMAEQIIAKAVEAGNGEDVTKAMRYRDQALARAQQLHQAKQQAAYQQQVQVQQKRDDVAPEIIMHAQEFMEDHPWYNPAGADEDSAIVMAIDQQLAREGIDSRSEEYWSELRRRVSKRLPDKAAGPRDDAPRRKPVGGPAVASGKEHAPTSTRREIYISPERKAALIEAGVWDDPVLRQKYIKRYAEYDRANSN